MHIGNIGRRLGKPRGDFGFLAFEFSHPRFHGRLIQPVLDRCHDARNRPVDLRQRTGVGMGLNTPLAVLAVIWFA